MGRLRKRLWFAWDAFRATPPERYFLVERIDPLGWRVLAEFDDYASAYDFRQRSTSPVRIMTDTVWVRIMCDLMRSDRPWSAVARLHANLAASRADVEDMRTMRNAVALDAFAQHHHP